jgi:murein DD-endopeptidase MepM/ murein hydrolase activator NlpD
MAATRIADLSMLHSLYVSAVRTAHLDPYRFRHRMLAAAVTLIAAAVVLPNGVSAIASTTGEEKVEVAPSAQVFVASALATMPLLEREEFTMDVRPPVMYPVGDYAVASGFGFRQAACDACSTDHRGVDWTLGYGTEIHAMADGVVAEVGTPGGIAGTLGHWMRIEHVIDGQLVSSVYAHMIAGSNPHRVGDEVRVGDVVGQIGTSGVTTAAHLHFEVHLGGTQVNPLAWLRAHNAAG